MLTAEQMASLRATQAAALPGSCDIYRRTATPDGLGGSTETPAVLASDVSCRLSPVGDSSEVVVEARFAERALWRLTLPASQDIAIGDQVAVGGGRYEVAGIGSGGEWESARRIILARAS